MVILTQKKRFKSRELIIDFERYRGQHVAIFNNRVIGRGSSATEAIKEALRFSPRLERSQLILFFVPKQPIFIYFFQA
ncbi:MAG: hypothetical protein A3G49_02430 [Candidatus Sungbacteria bacterium RIFCSPLOWO2_12_FULL_41_11]|uniref:DUF5678 domain-containing protein n=1 Tax=Candidatus Sungbacteria bacterium RIFCSPLOWO2_12_FULL_41_11 TaxID=1802286 RepID=A0A1G2LNK3_9BACT|nr:MAG: hypothetical protein A3D41_03305 [Candidatus Sungbacteria bacterium RIFCSPHIGHO2_02_FULL_41_12b]OHA13198.1 MAG: hypothetical protein A3G49_02430 [Candidatus Sungbacteria bacterium RIFCSPLOWO2_12_FULL_41_11]